MAIPGQRFRIDVDEGFSDVSTPRMAGFNIGLVGDIKERTASSNSRPPSPPRFKSSGTGFPAHKVRTGPSRFRKQQGSQSAWQSPPEEFANSSPEPSLQPRLGTINGTISNDGPGAQKRSEFKDPSIDQENKQRLAEMSEQEIEDARQELMAGLSPSLIEKLLKKANLDEGRTDTGNGLEPDGKALNGQKKTSTKKVSFEESEPSASNTPNVQDKDPHWDPEGPPSHPPPDLHPAVSYPSSLPQPPDIHFPIPQALDLDPSDPDFLSALHETYFPKLPADPSTMAWMAPLSSNAEEESAYSPAQGSHPVSALRFDFRGHLLPPRLSAQIASTKGLHHHAHAPSSAGYTVSELSHLARSSYPAQRCIAYQTLGRILYRLGRGDFGQEGEDLCEGLWQLMEQGKVVDQLVEAAAKGDSGNRSIWVIATEAVWLWRSGGGRRWRGR